MGGDNERGRWRDYIGDESPDLAESRTGRNRNNNKTTSVLIQSLNWQKNNDDFKTIF